jgi:hypothetical protein
MDDDIALRILAAVAVFCLAALIGKTMRDVRGPVPAPPAEPVEPIPSSRFYNFSGVDLVCIGSGSARIVDVTHAALRYVDRNGAEMTIDLVECARIHRVLTDAAMFPPAAGTDWAKLATERTDFPTLAVPHGCVGLRAVIDDPPWFQFLDRRRTQFEFKDGDVMRTELLRPLGQAGWGTWDAS